MGVSVSLEQVIGAARGDAALEAVLRAGVPALPSVTTIVLLGVVGYVLLAAYDRHRLEQQEPTRPRSDPERDRQAKT